MENLKEPKLEDYGLSEEIVGKVNRISNTDEKYDIFTISGALIVIVGIILSVLGVIKGGFVILFTVFPIIPLLIALAISEFYFFILLLKEKLSHKSFRKFKNLYATFKYDLRKYDEAKKKFDEGELRRKEWAEEIERRKKKAFDESEHNIKLNEKLQAHIKLLDNYKNDLKYKTDLALIEEVLKLFIEEVREFEERRREIKYNFQQGRELYNKYSSEKKRFDGVYNWMLHKKQKALESQNEYIVNNSSKPPNEQEKGKDLPNSDVTYTYGDSIKEEIKKRIADNWEEFKKISAENQNSEQEKTPPKESKINEPKIVKNEQPKAINESTSVKNANELIRYTREEDFQIIKKERKIILPENVDFLAQSALKKEIGFKGELFVMNYEIKKLQSLNRNDLAGKVQHTASEKNNSGYDIISFDENFNEICIEVKTTKGSYNSPFYLSENELNAINSIGNYLIYRVYNFDMETGIGDIGIIKGKEDLSSYFNMETLNYKAAVRIVD